MVEPSDDPLLQDRLLWLSLGSVKAVFPFGVYSHCLPGFSPSATTRQAPAVALPAENGIGWQSKTEPGQPTG